MPEAVSIAAIEEKLVREAAALLRIEPSSVDVQASLPALGLDSMGFVQLLVFVEKSFGLRLIESGLSREDFQTLRALATRIARGLPSA